MIYCQTEENCIVSHNPPRRRRRQVLTMFFLLTYTTTNAACFIHRVSGHPNFRPAGTRAFCNLPSAVLVSVENPYRSNTH